MKFAFVFSVGTQNRQISGFVLWIIINVTKLRNFNAHCQISSFMCKHNTGFRNDL